MWRKLWSLKVPPKSRNLVWRACNVVLPTADLLKRKGVDLDVICRLCRQQDESIFHVMVQCPFARQCWEVSRIGFILGSASAFTKWLSLGFQRLAVEDCCYLIRVCWRLWYNRNNVVWNS
ncbi:hypothetical protein P3X46_002438 [Hevea brasiliensis]|uniref:Reverse transcriptase zinc-binding domain-containing protein n=1 Tax=Hevea brasiliensis TaxID=3981 RepID=A0ABQ9N5N0_HEVBR|nr:hypothetical protein P3X46_002438 [Hevea brasiliensis]